MDLGEILILLALFGLPLLEQLFSHWKSSRQKGTPPAPPRDLPEAPPAPAPRREPLRVEPVGGWGDWTVLDTEAGTLEEPAVEAAADEEAESARWREGSDLPADLTRWREGSDHPEAARVSVPVVSLEPLHVDRAAEHLRFHRQAGPVPPRAAPAARTRLAKALANRDDVRRAVLMSEVLGPPRSLR